MNQTHGHCGPCFRTVLKDTQLPGAMRFPGTESSESPAGGGCPQDGNRKTDTHLPAALLEPQAKVKSRLKDLGDRLMVGLITAVPQHTAVPSTQKVLHKCWMNE